MDYWSRLIGGALPLRKPPNANSTQQRLVRFKQVYGQLLQLWQKRKYNLSGDPIAIDHGCTLLESLRRILQDEIQAPAPHSCIAAVASSRIYVTVIRIASASYDEGLVREALKLLNILIDCEEEEFLQDQGFADALTAFLLENASTGSRMVDVDTEVEIVEVLFSIAAKLRLQPEILPIWFKPQIQHWEGGSGAAMAKLHKREFPVFYLLLDQVHHDGGIGDFARTGLLYILGTASHSEILERWIIESDVATLMASGLGAVYSQLTRKLVMSYPSDLIPGIVTFSGQPQPSCAGDADETSSPEFQAHLTTFLSYLVFWQDVLEHCTSTDIKQTLLDHFQYLFLQQLLYPSLLQSSDSDGGSSVAALTYLRCTLESIVYPDLVHLILHYLLALPEDSVTEVPTSRPTTLARRRKSQNLVTLARAGDNDSPSLIHLVDLILPSLRSRNQQAVSVALQLVSTILHRQHGYAMSTLVKASRDTCTPRTISANNKGLNTLMRFADVLALEDDLDQSFNVHIHDARSLLESHVCSVRILELPPATIEAGRPSRHEGESILSPSVQPHRILPEDPLLRILLTLLDNFFANDVETNLSLTHTFMVLASCGHAHLEGWLLPCRNDWGLRSVSNRKGTELHPSNSPTDHDSHKDKEAEDVDEASKGQKPTSSATDQSPVIATLNSLVQRVEAFRREVRDFDRHLSERRQLFKIQQEVDEALLANPNPPQRLDEAKSAVSARVIDGPHIGRISDCLVAETKRGDVSRSPSPRGRQRDRATITLASRLSHLQTTPSSSPTKALLRPYSPSPLVKTLTPPRPSKAVPFLTGDTDILQCKLKVSTGALAETGSLHDVHSSEVSSLRSVSVGPEPTMSEGFKEVMLSHLLTNVVILHDFVLELGAMVQVRTSLFAEVVFE